MPGDKTEASWVVSIQLPSKGDWFMFFSPSQLAWLVNSLLDFQLQAVDLCTCHSTSAAVALTTSMLAHPVQTVLHRALVSYGMWPAHLINIVEVIGATWKHSGFHLTSLMDFAFPCCAPHLLVSESMVALILPLHFHSLLSSMSKYFCLFCVCFYTFLLAFAAMLTIQNSRKFCMLSVYDGIYHWLIYFTI